MCCLFQIICTIGRYALFFLYSAALSFLLLVSVHQFISPSKAGGLVSKYLMFGWGKFWSWFICHVITDGLSIKAHWCWHISHSNFCNLHRMPADFDIVFRGSVSDVWQVRQPFLHVCTQLTVNLTWSLSC